MRAGNFAYLEMNSSLSGHHGDLVPLIELGSAVREAGLGRRPIEPLGSVSR